MFEYSRSFPTAFLIAVCILAAAATFAAERPNIVIMGWDGAGYKTVEVLLENNQLPNLARLVNLGGGIAFLRAPLHGPTYTVPSWTEFFTGLTWDQTGVLGNNKVK